MNCFTNRINLNELKNNCDENLKFFDIFLKSSRLIKYHLSPYNANVVGFHFITGIIYHRIARLWAIEIRFPYLRHRRSSGVQALEDRLDIVSKKILPHHVLICSVFSALSTE